MEDKEIIRLLKTHQSEGLAAAMEKYQGGVHAIVSRILRGRGEDAEECVSDTFLRIWKAAGQGRIDPNTETFRGLVFSTARNLAVTRYNKLRAGQALPLQDAEEPADEREDILETITREETSRELQQAILAMKEPDRQIFFRRYFLMESIREIARRTGCTEVQVKNRLYRGRGPLQTIFTERGIDHASIG